MIIQPTLVLGVGGIGGRILASLSGKLSPEDKTLIRTVVLDTNVNDLQGAIQGGIDGGIQTSDNFTVGEFVNILEKNGEEPKSWFQNIPLLYDSSLLEGASQVRQKSRLALLATRQSGGLDDIVKTIDEVYSAYKEDFNTPINIIVVGSIAGGTCAGSMLQLPYIIRDLMLKHGVTTAIKMRALFIGPSVTYAYQGGNEEKIRDTFANAYACVKEINALYRFASYDKKDIPVKFECYKPTKEMGEIGTNPIPYDYVFMIEKHRTSGQTLAPKATPEDYEEMAANVLLAQLSQVGSTAAGAEDNLIGTVIKSEGMARFCGAGAYNIEYPLNGIIDYCADRCAGDNIGNQWRRIDEDFNRESRAQRQRAMENSNYEEEEFEDFYVRKFEEYSGRKSHDQFFKSLAYELQIIKTKPSEQAAANRPIPGLKKDSEGDSNSVVDNAFKEIKKLVKEESYGDKKVKTARIRCEKYSTESQVSEEIASSRGTGNIISSVQNYITAVENNLPLAMNTASKILSIEKLEEKGATPQWIMNKEDFNIAHVIKDKHPIVARYILLKLRSYMMAEVREDRENEQKYESGLFIFDSRDFDNTKDGIQSAGEVASAILKNSDKKRKAKKTKAALDEFSESLANALNEQRERILKYQSAAYKRRVFEEVLERIDSLLKTYALLFDSLPMIIKDINNEVMDMETLHNEDNERITRYVFARGIHKKIAYEVVKDAAPEDGLTKQTKEKFSESLYAYFAEYYSRSVTASTSVKKVVEERLKNNVRKLFEKKILPEIKSDISAYVEERFDRGIINALRFEVLCDDLLKEYKNDLEAVAYDLRDTLSSVETLTLTEEQEKNLRNILLQDVALKAGPYISTDIPKPHMESYWGVNPGIAEYGVSEGYVKNLLKLHDDQVVYDHSFTVNQMICYRILYCAEAHNLSSYNRSSEAYKLYSSKITDVLLDDRKRLYRKDKTIDTVFSPHIDKNWHKETFLPDIDPAKEEEKRFNDLLATAGILNSGLAEITEYAGTKRWKTNAFNRIAQPEEILIDGKLAPCTVYGLFNSMRSNQLLRDKIVEDMNKQFTYDRENETDIDKNILKHSLVKALTNIPAVTEDGVDSDQMTTILDMMYDIRKIKGDEWYRSAYENLFGYIMEYCKKASTGIIGQVEKLFDDIRNELIDKSRPETIAALQLR